MALVEILNRRLQRLRRTVWADVTTSVTESRVGRTCIKALQHVQISASEIFRRSRSVMINSKRNQLISRVTKSLQLTNDDGDDVDDVGGD